MYGSTDSHTASARNSAYIIIHHNDYKHTGSSDISDKQVDVFFSFDVLTTKISSY